MIEEEIKIEVVPFKLDVYLPSDKGKALSQRNQEFLDMRNKGVFKLPFAHNLVDAKEVKEIWIFEGRLNRLSLGKRKRLLEIGRLCTMSIHQPVLDADVKELLAPTVLQRLLRIPQSCDGVMQLVHQGDIRAPRDKCNGALHNFNIRPDLGELAHVLEITRRKSRHARKSLLKVVGQSINDLGTPFQRILPV